MCSSYNANVCLGVSDDTRVVSCRRLNNRLSWRRYTLAVNDEHGVIKTTDVDTRDVKPFHFVRVKNFS